MATAKKLPSGSWRVQVYSHTDENGKRIYKSFTSADPSPAGKVEAEGLANEYLKTNSVKDRKKAHVISTMTVKDIVSMYIADRKELGLSPKTIEGYEVIRDHAFPDLMDVQLADLDEDMINRAIAKEKNRTHARWRDNQTPISAKTIRNEWGLINSALHRYWPRLNHYLINVPSADDRQVELPEASEVIRLIRGTDIELPVLLAMWLSFSLSEIRGLTRSKSLSRDGNYLTITEVVVDVYGKPVRKSAAKTQTRKRKHRIPTYIKQLINALPSDQDALVSMSGQAIGAQWSRLQWRSADWEPITFHDLRHLNASVMALLQIPDKYAQERGGWKTDKVMKRVYQNTFKAERVRVDNIIDGYFEKFMQHECNTKKEKAL